MRNRNQRNGLRRAIQRCGFPQLRSEEGAHWQSTSGSSGRDIVGMKTSGER